MRHRLLLLLAMPLLPLPAQVTTRYQIETTNLQRRGMTERDARMADLLADDPSGSDLMDGMRGLPTQDSSRLIVSVTVRDSGGGRLVHMRIDSMKSNHFGAFEALKDSLTPAFREMMKDGVGGTLDVFMLKGRLMQLRPSPVVNISVGLLANYLPLIFPELRVGSRVGDRWSDTTATEADTTSGAISYPANLNQPVVRSWHQVSRDSLDVSIAAVVARDMFKMMIMSTEVKGEEHFLFDAMQQIKEAYSSLIFTERTTMRGEVASVSLSEAAVRIRRLGGSQ